MRFIMKKFFTLIIFSVFVSKIGSCADGYISIWVNCLVNKELPIERIASLVQTDHLNPGQAEMVAGRIREKLIRGQHFAIINELHSLKPHLFAEYTLPQPQVSVQNNPTQHLEVSNQFVKVEAEPEKKLVPVQKCQEIKGACKELTDEFKDSFN